MYIQIIKNEQITDIYNWDGEVRQTPGNAAFVHHGNQGLTYSSVFYGDPPTSNSGFDEILEVHQNTSIPGNFHMSDVISIPMSLLYYNTFVKGVVRIRPYKNRIIGVLEVIDFVFFRL